MFLLGVCALVDAFWAMAGDGLFGDVLGVLQPVLEDAVGPPADHLTVRLGGSGWSCRPGG